MFRRVRRAGGVFATAALSLALASCGSSGLPTSGTFTLSWKTTATIGQSNAPLKPIPYSGSVAGIPVSGTAANPATLAQAQGGGAGLPQIPKDIHLAQWTGSFDSKSFTLSVNVQGLGGGTPPKSLSQFVVVATGTYGSEAVRVSVVAASASSSTVHFAGTIGTHRVRGSLTIPHAKGERGTAKGTFTLTG